MLKNVVRGVMSHIRDVYVVHCIDKRVFISIPLTHEKGMMFQSARIENGELIIQGKMPIKSQSVNNQDLKEFIETSEKS